jgi:hypothetical protein
MLGLRWNVEARLVQAVDDPLEQIARTEPLSEFLPHLRGEVRLQSQELTKRVLRRLRLAELPVRSGERGVGVEVARHVHPECDIEGGTVVGPPVRAEERTEAIPPRMVGVELHRRFDEPEAMLPVPGVARQDAHEGAVVRVHWVEGDGAFRGAPERLDLAAEKEGLSEHVLGQVVRRGGRDSAPGRLERAAQRVRPRVEALQ